MEARRIVPLQRRLAGFQMLRLSFLSGGCKIFGERFLNLARSYCAAVLSDTIDRSLRPVGWALDVALPPSLNAFGSFSKIDFPTGACLLKSAGALGLRLFNCPEGVGIVGRFQA